MKLLRDPKGVYDFHHVVAVTPADVPVGGHVPAGQPVSHKKVAVLHHVGGGTIVTDTDYEEAVDHFGFEGEGDDESAESPTRA